MDNKKKSADSNVKVCTNCETVDPKLTCAKCKVTAYCSKACQKQHWKNGHKVACVAPEERRPQATTSRDIGGNLGKEHETGEKGFGSGKCSICLDSLSGCAVCTLPCNHVFHQECAEQLRKHGVQQVCPLCRAVLPAGPEKLVDDAARLYVAVLHQVGGDELESWQSLTVSQKRKMNTVIDMLTNAANQGYAQAQCVLGNMHDNGQGVAQDFKKAVQWYRKAADRGHAIAQINLGNMYNDGKGISQDHKKAMQWYRKAADQGHANAQYNLGVAYDKGQGVPQDNKMIIEWYRKAADQGHANAQNSLGVMYQYGHRVAQDTKKAVQWYRKAADQGNAKAQFMLGLMYYDGQGVAQDFKQAVQWYRKAADQGEAYAELNLGVMYGNGRGVAQDYKKAMQWYRKAADQGDADAQYNLGCMYQNGQGVTQDSEQAKQWLRKSGEPRSPQQCIFQRPFSRAR